MYDRKLKPAGPSYQFGSRFDDKRDPPRTKPDGSRFESALRAKPHLCPKKVDGPGPGDYKLHDHQEISISKEVARMFPHTHC